MMTIAKTERKVRAKRIAPRVAVLRLAQRFEWIARKLSPKDEFLQEDLQQEMALSVLEAPGPRHKKLYLKIARCRAKDYLGRFLRGH